MLTDIDKETNIEQIGANNPYTPTLELIKGAI